jgi:predicted permease
MLEHLLQDLTYTFRQTRRSLGFAAAVIGTLALGIGAAAALFTVVDHALIRPVQFKNADQLVEILKSTRLNPTGGTTPAWTDIEQWIEESHSFESFAYWTGMGPHNFLVKEPVSVEISGESVSPNLFKTLGVLPELGRDFSSASVGVDANPAEISDALWRGIFAGSKDILGARIRINEKTYTVLGVMPPGFKFPADAPDFPQIWVPADPAGDEVAEKRANGNLGLPTNYSVLARLRPATTLAGARTEMNVIQGRVASGYKDPNARKDNREAVLIPYSQALVGADIRKALLALLGASVVLWLIAVVNVTNLLLARSTARQREIAVRGALGASRGRVLQQMLVEGLVLSGAASLLGLGFAIVSIRMLARQLKNHLPLGPPSMTPDSRILLALLGMTILTAATATVWPAWLAIRAPIEPALRQGGQQAGGGRRQHRLRGLLVSVEIAMSLMLLVSCGLLLRSIYALRQVSLGYRTDHILVARLDVPSYRFNGRNVLLALYRPLLERVREVKGVEAAGLMSEVPLGNGMRMEFSMSSEGGKPPIRAVLKLVSPDIQRLFGMRMLVGRYFSSEDTVGSDAKVVVNRAFAQAYATDKYNLASALGMTMWELKRDRPLHIVGVLDDERQVSISKPSRPEVEICLCQMEPDIGMYAIASFGMSLALRTELPEKEIIPHLRAILRQAAPELEQSDITTMDQVVENSYGSQRLAAHLLEGFGGAALLLCIAGLYGLLAYIVAQRNHELGIRIALGASRSNLLWLVLRQASTMLLLGVSGGAVLAWLSARFVGSFVFDVSAHDGWTLSAAAVLMCGCGLLAAYFPARRAATIDPCVALRAE